MSDDLDGAATPSHADESFMHSERIEAYCASERLVQSRERMRRVLRGPHETDSETIPGSAGDRFSQQFPLLEVARIAGRQSLRQVADHHPWSLVAGAAVAGGLIAWLQPWRLLLRPAVLGALATRAMSLVPADVAAEFLMAQLAPKAAPESERS